MVAPFIEPELEWDFRLPNVWSISTSGHKYGLVYPGIGWVMWRSKEALPEDLIFWVSYLGGEEATMAINFSRSASQIIGQYYVFMRNGFEGYKEIQKRTLDVARHLVEGIKKLGIFIMYEEASEIPILCWSLDPKAGKKWTLYDLDDRLRMHGWQIPAYPLPENMQDVTCQRIVTRADLSMTMGRQVPQGHGGRDQEPRQRDGDWFGRHQYRPQEVVRPQRQVNGRPPEGKRYSFTFLPLLTPRLSRKAGQRHGTGSPFRWRAGTGLCGTNGQVICPACCR